MENQFYDRGMAELFRHPVFIRSLLVDFVAEHTVELLDLDSTIIQDGVQKEIA